ncbi:MAG: hypothetical protein JWM60_1706 [Solirubrobacterales bacterium]|nr:hypothetical protein [Solirubrobacterales bacterium]
MVRDATRREEHRDEPGLVARSEPKLLDRDRDLLPHEAPFLDLRPRRKARQEEVPCPDCLCDLLTPANTRQEPLAVKPQTNLSIAQLAAQFLYLPPSSTLTLGPRIISAAASITRPKRPSIHRRMCAGTSRTRHSPSIRTTRSDVSQILYVGSSTTSRSWSWTRDQIRSSLLVGIGWDATTCRVTPLAEPGTVGETLHRSRASFLVIRRDAQSRSRSIPLWRTWEALSRRC